jgi:hypothetical protein
MSDSPESVVRRFFAAWADPRPEELGSFFRADAVWVDGPQGVRRGLDAIKSELASQLNVVGGAKVDVRLLLSSWSNRSASLSLAATRFLRSSWQWREVLRPRHNASR